MPGIYNSDALDKKKPKYLLLLALLALHPELRQEGIIRVEVGKEGLHFIRDSGAFLIGNVFFEILRP